MTRGTITSPQSPRATYQAVASCMRELEGDIAAVMDMALILDLLFGSFDKFPQDDRWAIKITREEASAFSLMLVELENKTRHLQKRFYAAHEGRELEAAS